MTNSLTARYQEHNALCMLDILSPHLKPSLHMLATIAVASVGLSAASLTVCLCKCVHPCSKRKTAWANYTKVSRNLVLGYRHFNDSFLVALSHIAARRCDLSSHVSVCDKKRVRGPTPLNSPIGWKFRPKRTKKSNVRGGG